MRVNVTDSNARHDANSPLGMTQHGESSLHVPDAESGEMPDNSPADGDAASDWIAPDGWLSTAEDFSRVGLTEQENRLAVIRMAARRSTGALAQSQLQQPNAKNQEQLVTVVTSVYRVMDPRRRSERVDQVRVGRILPLDLQATMVFERYKRKSKPTGNPFLAGQAVSPADDSSMPDESSIEADSASDSLYDLIADADRILKSETPVAVDIVEAVQTREDAVASARVASAELENDVAVMDIPDPHGTLREARQFIHEVNHRRSWLPTAWVARHRLGLASLIACVCVAALFLNQWQRRLDERRARFQATVSHTTPDIDSNSTTPVDVGAPEIQVEPKSIDNGVGETEDPTVRDHSNSLLAELGGPSRSETAMPEPTRIDEPNDESATGTPASLDDQRLRNQRLKNRLRRALNGDRAFNNDMVTNSTAASPAAEDGSETTSSEPSTAEGPRLAADPVSNDDLRDAIDTMIKDTSNLVSRFNVSGAGQLISHWERRSQSAAPGSAAELAALHLCLNAAWLSEGFPQVQDRASKIVQLQANPAGSAEHEVATLLVDSLLETTRRLTVTRDLNQMLLQANRCLDLLITSTQHEVPLSRQADIQTALRFADDAGALTDLEDLLNQMECLPSRHDVATMKTDNVQRGAFGRYACLQQRDWTNGLSALTEHVDTFLSATANAEHDLRFDSVTGNPNSPTAGELAMIGLRWSRVARRFQGREAAAIRLHAIELMSGDPAFSDDIEAARKQLPSYLIDDSAKNVIKDSSTDARAPLDNTLASKLRR